MSYKRIRDSELPDIFQNGDFLTSDDLNQIITVFKDGINYNKDEVNKIITGKETANIAYDLETLYSFSGVDGDYAYLINPVELGDGIKLYKHQEGVWMYITDLSLVDIYDIVLNMPTASPIVTSVEQPQDAEYWFHILDGTPENPVYDTLSGGTFTEEPVDILSGGIFTAVLTDTIEGGSF